MLLSAVGRTQVALYKVVTKCPMAVNAIKHQHSPRTQPRRAKTSPAPRRKLEISHDTGVAYRGVRQAQNGQRDMQLVSSACCPQDVHRRHPVFCFSGGLKWCLLEMFPSVSELAAYFVL